MSNDLQGRPGVKIEDNVSALMDRLVIRWVLGDMKSKAEEVCVRRVGTAIGSSGGHGTCKGSSVGEMEGKG